ncbi:MAG: hypothetical protein ACKVHH_02235 [Candidatus Poseidoniales archaeon]|jgi:hypothetical protein
MAMVPAELITQLAAMDEYERLLAADTASKNLGVKLEDLMNMIDSHLKGGTQVDSTFTHLESASQGQEDEVPQQQSAAHHLQDAHRYRMKYDPSTESTSRSKEITDAIVCPHCNAPLGIPSVRPIKVNCPNCMNESTFHV